MRCSQCRTVVAPGPTRCPHCGGGLELGAMDVLRWTLISVVRGLRSGRFSTAGMLVAAAAMGGAGYFGAQALFGGANEAPRAGETGSTIAQMRPRDGGAAAAGAAASTAAARTAIPEPKPAPVQTKIEPWRQVIGGKDDEVALQAALLQDGGIVFLARSADADAASVSDTIFVRTDPAGVVRQQAVVAALVGAQALAVDAGAQDEIYVAGNDGGSVSVMRVNDLGEMRWGSSFSVSTLEGGVALSAAPDGGVFVASAGEAQGEAVVVRFDSAGGEIWRRTAAADGLAGDVDLQSDEDGGVFLGFVARDGAGQPAAPQVIRLDEDGEALWRHALEARAGGALGGLAKAPSGGVFASGASGGGTAAPWLASLSGAGVLEWDADLKGEGVVAPVVVSAARGSGVHLAAATAFDAESRTGGDLWIARFDADGGLLWDSALTAGDPQTVSDLAVTPGADLVIPGGQTVGEDGTSDMLMLRLAKGGVPPLGLSEANETDRDGDAAERDASDRDVAETDAVEMEGVADAGLAAVASQGAGAAGTAAPAVLFDTGETGRAEPAAGSGGDAPDVLFSAAAQRQEAQAPLTRGAGTAERDDDADGETAQANDTAELAETGEADGGEAAQGADGEEAAQTFACAFRCATPDGVVKFPVNRTYPAAPGLSASAFAAGLAADVEEVCTVAGGVPVDDEPPVCQ